MPSNGCLFSPALSSSGSQLNEYMMLELEAMVEAYPSAWISRREKIGLMQYGKSIYEVETASGL